MRDIEFSCLNTISKSRCSYKQKHRELTPKSEVSFSFTGHFINFQLIVLGFQPVVIPSALKPGLVILEKITRASYT